MAERLRFLAAGGETGALIASHDWSATPLGPIERWPQSLLTALGLVVRSPIPIVLLWGTEGVMLYNDAYSVFAGGRHPELLGSNVREGWPEVADFNDNVMRVGLAGGMLSYKDQELTLQRRGRAEQVWLNLDYSPVPDESGRPAGVLAVVVETTERVIADRRHREGETALRAERDRTRGVLDNMGEAFTLLDHDFRIVDINGEALRLEGRTREDVVGLTYWEAHPDTVPELGDLFRCAMEERIPVALEHRYRWPDGRVSWIAMRAFPVESGLAVFYRDVTERKEAEERQAFLAREVDHRAKNALAVALAAVRLTKAPDMANYVRSVEGRVVALARAQTLLSEDRWAGADLEAMVRGELTPFISAGEDGGPRAELGGPKVNLPAGAAQPFAMALHELATNAMKHGALSVANGRVAVSWSLDGDLPRTLRLGWWEAGGPAVPGPPSRKGFGTRVLEATVRDQLRGRVTLTWEASGLVCDIAVPLNRLNTGPDAVAGSSPRVRLRLVRDRDVVNNG